MTGNSGQIVIDAVLEAVDGHDERLATLLRETQHASRTEPGCIAYRMTRDLDTPDRFYVFEIWQDEPALTAHAKAPAFLAFLEGLALHGRLVGSKRWIGPLSPYEFKRAQEVTA